MKTPEHIKEFKEQHSDYWESFSDELEDIFTGSDKALANYIESSKESLEGAIGGRNIYTVALEEAIHRLKMSKKSPITDWERYRIDRGFF